MRFNEVGRRGLLAAALVGVVLTGTARAQGDGPHALPLAPVGMNIGSVIPMGLWGNFNPQQTVLIPGADVDVFALPVTYIRTFAFGNRFGRLFMTAPLATLDASATIFDPLHGALRDITPSRTGWMDPIVTMHVGLVGAPALKPMEFVKHPRSFQMVGIVGTMIPIGTYDSSRAVNLGTNRWTFRVGAGTVVPMPNAFAWESTNSVMLFTDNDDVFGPASSRSQDPLFISENHLTRVFNPKWWGSVDLRYQVGGETATDGREDDNRTNILGGGLSLGHQFNQKWGGYVSYGRILAKKGDAEEQMIRVLISHVF